MSALKLRLYQETALADLYAYFTRESGNPLVVLPTGSGKSLVIAEWCRLVFDQDPRARIIILTHVQELVAQNYTELMGMWPDAPAGIYSAGLNRRELGARILFASIQSIHDKASLVQECDMVLVDEAHLIPRKSETTYRRFLADLRKINPHLKIIGLTATPFRLDSGMLHEGDGAMFDHIAHETPVRQLIEEGFLCRPVTFPKTTEAAQIDTTGVRTVAGEFKMSDLEVAALDPETIAAIADRIVAAGADRRGWIVFGCSVKHCEALSEALTTRGIASGTIFGDTDKTARARTIAEFKAGRLRALVSMGVLTTGFNAKHVDLVALARPTKSTGLYIQMVGRGTRPLYGPGDLTTDEGRIAAIANGPKPNCLVLDFGGNITRHGPFDDPFIKKPKKGEGPAPFKYCPECGNACATAVRRCPACDHEFPPPETLVKQEADDKPILAAPPAWIEVNDTAYSRHEKRGGDGPATFRVDYRCGLITHSEWICFDHSGYARTKAEAWWRRRSDTKIPGSVDEALARVDELEPTAAIQLMRDGDYMRVARHQLLREREPAT
jgi:DNA repair protein RadD